MYLMHTCVIAIALAKLYRLLVTFRREVEIKFQKSMQAWAIGVECNTKTNEYFGNNGNGSESHSEQVAGQDVFVWRKITFL